MKAMRQALRASEALRAAADAGALDGTLTPAVFGCPYGHAARIITSPLPLGRCGECGMKTAILDAEQLGRAIRRVS